MIELDAEDVHGSGSYLRTALSLAVILQKPVLIKNFALQKTFKGLSADNISLIRALATATDAKLSGVEIGSTSISFTPSRPWSQKKISLGLQGSVSLALQGLLLPALFSRQKVRFHITGRTHGLQAPTTTYMQQVFFRYLHSLVDQLVLRENAFGFKPTGDVEVVVKGRVNRLPPLRVSGNEKLAGIRLELVASKDLLKTQVLARFEQLAKLMHPKLTVSTRYVTSAKSGIAGGIFAFYGDAHGFDNDKPFVFGEDAIWQGEDMKRQEDVEKSFTLFVKQFLDKLDYPAVDEFCADQLIMLLALVGGTIKVRVVTQRVKANIAAAQAISGTHFSIVDTTISATPRLDEL